MLKKCFEQLSDKQLLLFCSDIILIQVHSQHSRFRHLHEPVLGLLGDGPGLEVELLHLLVDVDRWGARSQHTLSHLDIKQ